MRHSVSRSDALRLARLQCLLGHAPDRNVLWIVDGIRLPGSYPGRLITDAMVALWAAEPALRTRFADLGQPATQRGLLTWYCCERTPDTDGTAAATLQAAAAIHLAESGFDGLPYTGLIDIASAHCFAQGAAPPLRGDDLADNVIAWFYCRGAVEAGVSDHISPREHAVLRAPYVHLGKASHSLATLWTRAMRRTGSTPSASGACRAAAPGLKDAARRLRRSPAAILDPGRADTAWTTVAGTKERPLQPNQGTLFGAGDTRAGEHVRGLDDRLKVHP